MHHILHSISVSVGVGISSLIDLLLSGIGFLQLSEGFQRVDAHFGGGDISDK